AAGLSVLEARLSVYDAGGHLVGSATAAAPGADLTVHLDATKAATYFVKVEKAADDVFAVGSYRLEVTPDEVSSPTRARRGFTRPAPARPALGDSFANAL